MNNKNPFISIIIPSKNEEEYLPILLESIKQQDYSDFEIIVADNESSDNTLKVAKDFGCLTTRGGMPGAGRNYGAEIARGKYLLFLDADVRLTPGSLKNLEKVIKEKRIETATCFTRADSNKLFDNFCFVFANFYLYLLQGVNPHTYGCFTLIRADIFEKLNGFNEKLFLAEDHDLAIRAKKVGKFEVLALPKVFRPYVSVRRLVKEGRMRHLLNIAWVEFYRLHKREVTEKIVAYDHDLA